MYKIKNSIFAASCVASILFIAITTLGLSLATLPLYVSESLGYSAFYVGLVVAAESLSTLFSRAAAGRYSDNHGPRKGMILGLSLTLLAGLFCLFSFSFIDSAKLAFFIIIFSRILMGIGESLIFTCSGTWPIGLVGREHAGKIMSWVGIAMFLGLALGNYAGTWSYYNTGIIISAISMVILPALGFLLVAIVKPVAIHPERNKTKLSYAVHRIWKAGSGFSLANIGYASITTFLVLYFIQNGWGQQAAFALSLFGVGYVVSRLTLGWKADSSGLKLTLFSITIEAVGLLFIALSSHPYEAMLGSFLTGFGLSMIYPLLALPALKSMPSESIGLALSTYESCFDIGILIAGLVGGVVVSLFGYPAVFIFAFFCCLLASVSSILAYKQISSEVSS
ncbi:MFS transporter [Lonsdalea populi]|uniref:MFS transporter n=1 Tax=Lonsdalea populi TaxID=1172565 RepID=UPI000A23BBCF|nr:MFS transporter [Lonsdalea populi]OSM94889.1 MFS transporter [Lonsdalea populi]RAT68529.1 MFS transporter [Lonsdalea populi]RAT69417.1 MFS transporter [Lonsdalea populi]RAT73379.1 MFS transporter [Lonsdalea populi]RAT79184.1 MFS transporter [Lonsdalea populi]